MDPMTLMFIVVGAAFVAFHVGYIIGHAKGTMSGFSDGADRGVKSVLEQLSKEIGLSFEYNVNIVDGDKDEQI